MYLSNRELTDQQKLDVTRLLQARLSDALDLAAQLKQAHWNVKGPAFHQLHLLFDTIFATTQDQADLLAERIVTLGGRADGRVQTTALGSGLDEYPIDIDNGEQHLATLAAALTHFAGSVRADIDSATELGDAGTADIFTEVSRGADKHLWFVSAHLPRLSG